MPRGAEYGTYYRPADLSSQQQEIKNKAEISVRPYHDSDCQKVVQLMHQNFDSPAFSLYPRDVINAYKAANSEADTRHAVRSGGTEAYIAETADGTFGGYLLIRYNQNQIPRRNAYGELDLRRLHVNPNIQGQGIGKKLFDVATQRARLLNIEYITSHASGSSRLYFEQNGWNGKTILDPMPKRRTSAIVFAATKRVTPPPVDLFKEVSHVAYAGSNIAKAEHLQKALDQKVVRVPAKENKDTQDVYLAAQSKAFSAAANLRRHGHEALVVANDIRTDILVLNPLGADTRYYFMNRGKPSNVRNGDKGIDEVKATFDLMLETAKVTKKPAPYVVRSATYFHNSSESDADTSTEQDVSVWLTQEGLEELTTSKGLKKYREQVYDEYGIDITEMAGGFALPVFLKRGYVAGLFGHPFDTLPNKDAAVDRAVNIVIGGIDVDAVRKRLGYLQ